MKNIIALMITFGTALVWLRMNNFFTHKGWISSELSRKIIHIGTGPIFVLCWLLYSESTSSRYLAAFVPLAITLQFILVGLGVIKDQSAVESMSRTGDRKEILRGPLIYGIAFVILTIVFWRDSPTGIIALMLLCGGDGLADIVGRRLGKRKLPWNKRKSWMGSLAMFLGGMIFAGIFFLIFQGFGYFNYSAPAIILGLLIISIFSTIIESISPIDFDNATIPLSAILLGLLLW